MNKIFLLIIVFILIIYACNLLIKQMKKATYLKASKKWDGIVKELSKRK